MEVPEILLLQEGGVPAGGGGRNNDRKYIIECFRHLAGTSRKGLMFFYAHIATLFLLFTPYYIIRAHARARGRMVPKTTLKPCFWNHAQFPLNSRTILAEFARKFLRNHAQFLRKSRTNSAGITNKFGGNHAWFQKTLSFPVFSRRFFTSLA